MQDPENSMMIAFCSVPSSVIAQELAQRLVERKLAACVNLIPKVMSVYSWQGKIEQTEEVLLLIKTNQQKITKIEQMLDKEHPYQVPELIGCNIETGSNGYLDWLQQELK